MFELFSSRAKRATCGKYGDGKIKQVARHECGGEEGFEEALREGTVVESNGLCYFRSIRLSEEDIFQKKEHMKHGRKSKEDELRAFSGAIDDLFGETDESLDKLGRFSSGSRGSSSSINKRSGIEDKQLESSIRETFGNLESEAALLQKIIKVAENDREKNIDKVKCDRGYKALAALTDTLENAEFLKMNSTFAKTYKKCKGGTPMDSNRTNDVAMQCKTMVQCMLADLRSFRVQLPKQPKETA